MIYFPTTVHSHSTKAHLNLRGAALVVDASGAQICWGIPGWQGLATYSEWMPRRQVAATCPALGTVSGALPRSQPTPKGIPHLSPTAGNGFCLLSLSAAVTWERQTRNWTDGNAFDHIVPASHLNHETEVKSSQASYRSSPLNPLLIIYPPASLNHQTTWKHSLKTRFEGYDCTFKLALCLSHWREKNAPFLS